MPDFSNFPLELGAQFINEDLRKAFFPIPHSLVGKCKAWRQKEFHYISVAHLIA